METTLASLSLREKAGQVVVRWIPGSYVARDSEEFDDLLELVDAGVGGVSISIGLPHSYAAKLNALQRRADLPLLVTADFESGGPGMRISGAYALPSLLPMGGGTELPPTMAFGAIGEERFVRELGRITGREARAVGVHLTFAPVVDVNNNPRNPIINTRAFGEDPFEVGRLAAAYLRGARESGILTTAKHFPGHGDTDRDSHLELARIDADRLRLDTLELVPFRRAVEEGVDAVMTAHLAVPGVTGSDTLPATFSKHLVEEVLRGALGFRGLVVTDALTMDAVSLRYPDAEIAVRALAAGNDVLLSPRDVEAAIEGVVSAVESGRVPEARLDTAVRRVLATKARAGLHEGRQVSLESVDRVVGRREHRAFADTAAVRGLTLPRDGSGLVPLPGRVRDVFSVTLARDRNPEAGRDFDRELRSGGLSVESARVRPTTPPAVYDSLKARARDADAVLLSVYLPPEAGEGTVAVPPAFGAFARGLLESGKARKRETRAGAEARDPSPPILLLSFGSPYLLDEIPGAESFLLAWGGRAVSQRAAARALLGAVPVTGTLPVSLPPHHGIRDGLWRGPLPTRVEGRVPAGFGDGWWRDAEGAPGTEGAFGAPDLPDLLRVDSVIEAAVADSVTPGAALAVGWRGHWLRLRGYGTLDWNPGSPAVTDSTLYDLASLTKAVGTATAVMRLAEEGRVDLDTPVSEYLPWWDGEDPAGDGSHGAGITVRHLLQHRSGLPAHRPWWEEREGREEYREALRKLEPVAAPGDSTVYSDPGFMLLGFLVEEVTGRSLDAYLEETVFAPLGMGDTGFRPDPALRERIAPTEVDTLFRGEHLRGVVHDENAHAMGGVAGHAGLFSSVRDLAVFAQTLQNGGWGAPRTGAVRPPGGDDDREAGEGYALTRIAGPRSIAAFTGPENRVGGRAPGWSGGEGPFSSGAFGHTGFTGTSLWIDPDRDLFVVLLTNRVNPTREETRHVDLRRAVHRAVVDALPR